MVVLEAMPAERMVAMFHTHVATPYSASISAKDTAFFLSDAVGTDQELLCVAYRSGEVRLLLTTNVSAVSPPEPVADQRYVVPRGQPLGELTSMHVAAYRDSQLLVTGHRDGRICVRDLRQGFNLVALAIGALPAGGGHVPGRGAVTHLGSIIDPTSGELMLFSAGADGRTNVWQVLDG